MLLIYLLRSISSKLILLQHHTSFTYQKLMNVTGLLKVVHSSVFKASALILGICSPFGDYTTDMGLVFFLTVSFVDS
jgi:hypothetical protein